MATSTDKLKQQLIAEVNRLQDEANHIAADMHAHPEVGWETPRSAGLLIDYMEKHGLAVESGIAGLDHAFRGSIKGREGQRPGVAFLAEYDALPDLGHACSHNIIGTAAATAGIALGRVLANVPDLKGNVHVMGTPFEEGGGGKIIMLDQGAFDQCDASLMFHGSNRVQVGCPNLAFVEVNYQFFGRPAHGGRPEDGINAADAAMLTFSGINALRQHMRSDARVSGYIEEAGKAQNIVPEYASVRIGIRALDQRYVAALTEKIDNCARAGALATGAELKIERGPRYFERIVVPRYRPVVMENLRLLGIEVPEDDPQGTAGADSGNVSYAMPHLTFNLPMDQKGSVPHTAEFAEACNSEQGRWALGMAAKTLALSALDLIADPELLASIREQHRELLAERQAVK